MSTAPSSNEVGTDSHNPVSVPHNRISSATGPSAIQTVSVSVPASKANPATIVRERLIAIDGAAPTKKPAGRQQIVKRIQKLGPWHMNIQLGEDLNTGQVFSEAGEIYDRPSNDGVSLLRLRDYFLRQIDRIYPDGLTDKHFLDCACNAGGYCFWTRERDVKAAFGFDVREHWIKQARFVKNRRTVAPTDRIKFQVRDLYDLPGANLPKFDVTMFKGIFYHLPDPVTGLKIAADMTNEVMFFNTSTTWGQEDGFMKAGWESRENVMSGVHGLKWYPTGPQVCAEMLKWMGFVEMKLVFYRQQRDKPELGRTEIVASKVPGLLENLRGEPIL